MRPAPVANVTLLDADDLRPVHTKPGRSVSGMLIAMLLLDVSSAWCRPLSYVASVLVEAVCAVAIGM